MTETFYKIENLQNPQIPRDNEEFEKLMSNEATLEAIRQTQERYLAWQEFRLKSWVPPEKEKIWALIKMQREFNSAKTPIKDKDGSYYTFNPRTHVEFLHLVDLELGGNFMGVSDFSENDRKQIIRRRLIEESIASSRLEGANTSREVARKMLNEGRKPTNKSERMIVNNHVVMTQIEEELKNEPMSVELLMDLHSKVTKGTLKKETHEGMLRETLDEKGNRLKIYPWDQQTVVYTAPDKEFVESQLPKLISFANDETPNLFIHPLIKAIMLHFWVGLLHPFEDGNGRLARILFYWYMLRKGYWAFSYLSLSEMIIKSPKQYAMSYIFSEQDGYDLNYFIHYNMNKLKLARKKFETYLQEKIKENRQANKIIQSGYNFNPRQLRLLQYLAKDEQRYTTPKAYHNNNSEIARMTVHQDLKKLLDGGFLKRVKNGRNVYYYPTENIKKLMM